MRVVVVAGHSGIEQVRTDLLRSWRDVAKLRAGTGTRGEREMTGYVAGTLAGELRARGHDAVATDSSGDETVRAPADLLLAIHGQRDSTSSRAFAGSPDPTIVPPYISAAAAAESARFCDVFHANYPQLAGIPTTPERGAGANLTGYYLWDFVDRETRCALIEVGHMDMDAAVIFAPGSVVKPLADICELWAGVHPPAPPPPDPPATPAISAPVLGASVFGLLAPAALARALWTYNPRASIAIPFLYAQLCALAGIRAEVAFAQAMHETGWLTFPRLARPEWNNFAGIGCDEATKDCARFATAELGIRAHLGHLLCYFGEHRPPFCEWDPRHELVGHRHLANELSELGGKWAPNPAYGTGIIAPDAKGNGGELAKILAAGVIA